MCKILSHSCENADKSSLICSNQSGFLVHVHDDDLLMNYDCVNFIVFHQNQIYSFGRKLYNTNPGSNGFN